jgi:DNA-directed RNA polymerase specialized sigma24 family protein
MTRLAGNARLMDVICTKGCDIDVSDQIGRSISAALSITRRRMRRAAAKESARWQVLSEAEAKSKYDGHTSHRSFWSLPYAAQRELALLMLRNAASQARISQKSAALASAMIEEELTQAEMARRLNISRAAVHQRLAPVRQVLRAVAQEQELPSSTEYMIPAGEGGDR